MIQLRTALKNINTTTLMKIFNSEMSCTCSKLEKISNLQIENRTQMKLEEPNPAYTFTSERKQKLHHFLEIEINPLVRKQQMRIYPTPNFKFYAHSDKNPKTHMKICHF